MLSFELTPLLHGLHWALQDRCQLGSLPQDKTQRSYQLEPMTE
jgi:hypothetical protein